MKKGITIAIDGPVASGKGTIAPLLAEKLDAFNLPTGSMYRCVVLYSLRQNILSDQEAIIKALPAIHIRFSGERVFLNDDDVTEEIHTNDISRLISRVAGVPAVRHALVEQMRTIRTEILQQGNAVIAEGRDIGTVVFPNAEIKLYLTAKPEVRAKRRFEQLQLRGDVSISFEQVLSDTIARDTYDREETKALVTDPEKNGYTVLDTSNMTEEKTLQHIYSILQERGYLHD